MVSRHWLPGDLEDAVSDGRDYQRERRASQEARREACDRARRFRETRDDFRQQACALLQQTIVWDGVIGLGNFVTNADLVMARRFARAAERVDAWLRDAERKSYG